MLLDNLAVYRMRMHSLFFIYIYSETNLKVRQPLMETFSSIKTDKDLIKFKGNF